MATFGQHKRIYKMLPNRIRLSTKSTGKLRYLKAKTGLTPNVLARIAIMLAIKEGSDLSNAGVNDTNGGQELNDSTLFGEYIYLYDVLINQYITDKDIQLSTADTIIAMIEIGVHKMGHVKQLEHLAQI